MLFQKTKTFVKYRLQSVFFNVLKMFKKHIIIGRYDFEVKQKKKKTQAYKVGNSV